MDSKNTTESKEKNEHEEMEKKLLYLHILLEKYLNS